MKGLFNAILFYIAFLDGPFYIFSVIPIKEALRRILSTIPLLGTERVFLLEALNRISGEEVVATRNLPFYAHSKRDGYAVRYEDVKEASPDSPIRLKEIGEVRAGFFSEKRVQKGEALRIMTGAPIPEGADTIIPLEETQKEDRFVHILRAFSPGQFIRKEGEEVRIGDRVLSAGELVRPYEIGLLASLGRSTLHVYQRPRVALLATGEELIDVDEPFGGAKIISSNLYTLTSQVRECGAYPIRLGIVRDQKEEMKGKILEGLRSDLVITSAGTSAGDYDLTREVIREMGGELIFSQVAMKPGKTVAFWRLNGKPIFNLPGSPMACMISFEELVRPALLKMMGHLQVFRPAVEGKLKEDLPGEGGLYRFIYGRVSFEQGAFWVTPILPKDPGWSELMRKANGLITIPEDQEAMKAGDRVSVQLLDLNF